MAERLAPLAAAGSSGRLWMTPGILALCLLIPVARASAPQTSGTGTLLHFSIHVTSRVHSRIRVDLHASGRAGSPVVADRLANRKLVWAIGTIRHQAGRWLRFHTSGFTTRPVAWAHGRITEWQATDVLTLESTHGKRIGRLLALLEKRLAVSNARYEPVGSARVRHGLMLKGLHELAGLARHACAALGKTGVQLLDIRITPMGRPFRPRPLLTFAGVARPLPAVPALQHSLRVKLTLAARIRCGGSSTRPGVP